jgi:flagellar FliL protein
MSVGKIVAIAGAVAILAAGIGVGGTWWLMKAGENADTTAAVADAPVRDKRTYKYVSLEKVIVMLRNVAGDPATHYLAVDLVFKSPEGAERSTREQLPFLRSVAVKALSMLTLEEASRMTVDELTATINLAYEERYRADGQERPFVDVMIGKLLVE